MTGGMSYRDTPLSGRNGNIETFLQNKTHRNPKCMKKYDSPPPHIMLSGLDAGESPVEINPDLKEDS